MKFHSPRSVARAARKYFVAYLMVIETSPIFLKPMKNVVYGGGRIYYDANSGLQVQLYNP